jgi:hypothetical protein
MSPHYIKRIFTENTGGGSMVDFVELWDGKILGINDEFVVLYESMKAFYEGENLNCQSINLKGQLVYDTARYPKAIN